MRVWFKMSADIYRDRKVRTLTLEETGFWALLLGVAKNGDGLIPRESEIAWETRIDDATVSRLVASLQSKGFLISVDGGYEPNDWSEHQGTESRDRMRAKRARDKACVTSKGGVTASDERCVTGQNDVTPRTEQRREEQNREDARGGLRVVLPEGREPREELPADLLAGFEEFIAAYPNQVKTDYAAQTWLSLFANGKLTAGMLPDVMAGLERWKVSALWERDGGRYIPAPHKFILDALWKDFPPKGEGAKARENFPEWEPPKKRRKPEGEAA